MYCRITRLDTIKREVETVLHHIAVSTMEYFLLCRSRSGVGVGVDISRPKLESESESVRIRRLRSPVANNKLQFMVPMLEILLLIQLQGWNNLADFTWA